MSVCEITRGTSPVILGFPHTGTAFPSDIHERLNDNGRLLADTDWHLHTLYDGLLANVTTVRATFHRYVIDANRDPAGGSLYPGQNTTGLVPLTDFDGKPIWREGQEPTATDVAARVASFHAPYHAALAAEIARVMAMHGAAVLYDCHSIRSHIPFLFEGKLPDFNIGTGGQRRTEPDNGERSTRRPKYSSPQTCCQALETAVVDGARAATGFTRVVNGRFKGGWTTRHYGAPESEVNAIQMELAQSTYLVSEMPPFAYDPAKAEVVRAHLKSILERVESIAVIL